MQKKGNFLYVFIILIIISVLLFALSKTSFLDAPKSLVQLAFSPVQSAFFNLTHFNQKISQSKEQNIVNIAKLADINKLEADNKALRDQFETGNQINPKLIPAQIIGEPAFIPGFSYPETYIINEGKQNGIREGDAVLYKNTVVGKISKVYDSSSVVMLITNSSSSFTAKTMSGSISGIINGQGGGVIIFDNVLLSENLKIGDLVLTKGDINTNGVGFPPDLVIGKIKSVNKNPSALFQKAEIESPLDFEKLSLVFVLVQ